MRIDTLFNPIREVWKRSVNLMTGVRDAGPPRGAQMIAGGAAVLDVRDPPEWARGVIPGSILIPLTELQDRWTEIGSLKARTLLVVCHGGKRSATACRILRRRGFSSPVNLAGGVLAWSRAGLPMEAPDF